MSGLTALAFRTPDKRRCCCPLDCNRAAPEDWAWNVGGEQRQLLVRIVGPEPALPTPEDLAKIIRKHSAAREAAVRELIDADLALEDASDDGRLTAAVREVHQYFT